MRPVKYTTTNRVDPIPRSRLPPITHNRNMLNPRWSRSACKKPAVITRHQSPSCTHGPTSSPQISTELPFTTAPCKKNVITVTITIVTVAGGRPACRSRARMTFWPLSATQFGQWKPTAAWLMQSVQIARSHR